MTFLNPLVLIGLAAAAIPLIIHLFNFRRPRKLDFSSLEFLKELQKTTMQRVRIKQWLLLLLRTLAIACLVLTFARPTLTGGIAGALGGRATSDIALLLDNSLSMTMRDAQGAFLSQAKEVAAELLDQVESGDNVYVMTTADRSAAQPAPYKNRLPALDAIDDVEAQYGTRSLETTIARAAAVLDASPNLNKEIYVVSDAQRSTLTDSTATSIPGGVKTVLLPVGDRTFANVAVTDVEIGSRIIEVGQPVRINATVVNYGDEPLDDYVASVFLEEQRVAQASVDLPPRVPTEVSFTATPQRRGWLSGIVQIEDDDFTFDNVRYFAMNVPERRRLLLVRGENQRTDYVQLAFSPELSQGRVAFDVETIPESALAATGLGAYDAVLLVGPRTLSSGEISALARYVAEGGGLLLFPNPAAAAEDYNGLLASLGGGSFSGFSGELGSARPIASFDRVDLEHVLFEGVFNRRSQGAEVESPEIYYAMNYTPSTGNEQTLIRLSNGFPFLQEIRHARGVVFVMGVAPDPQWSDLPVRGLFIPLMYRSMYYLSSSESVSGEQLTVGAGGELRLAGVADTQPLRIVGPSGDETTPEQRNLFGAVLLQIAPVSLMEPGVYDIYSGEQLQRRIALNLDVRESDLHFFDGSEAASRLSDALGSDVHTIDIAGAGGVAESLAAERTGVELWNVFLLLALAFLVAEMIVAKRWRPEAAPA